jgi:hypothetical protein
MCSLLLLICSFLHLFSLFLHKEERKNLSKNVLRRPEKREDDTEVVNCGCYTPDVRGPEGGGMEAARA